MNVASDAIIDVTPIEVPREKPKNRKKLLIIGGAAALLLAAGGGGAWWMLRGDSAGGSGHEAAAPAAASAGTDSSSYIEVPPVIVNLRSGDGQARFLKLRFILVAADAAKVDGIKERLPVVLDALQPFLRELRPDDLAGSAAVFRIKEEMMSRTTQALGAGTVHDVLIQDLVQQ
ncbi:flagellar basal body-associated FliL family protein [Sphingobium sp.]|uniref:flagellar basal body-associated FliL family protein n=1 Tax=Sphingobium sp. TaxID=1912891 RepID=UPI0039C99B45